MKLTGIREQIVTDLQVINPEKIILFGSLARGGYQEGKSDIDLLIIKDTQKKLADRYSEARLSLTLNYPFDIFVLTPEELEKKVLKSFFFREILEKGEVLYER